MHDREDFINRETSLDLLSAGPRLYDRVPYISDLVYAFLNARTPVVTSTDVSRFIDTVKPIIIYCRLTSSTEMVEHISMEKKAHKPPEYMEKVKLQHPALCASYDKVMHDLVLHHQAKVLHFNWKKDSRTSLSFTLDNL